MDAKRPSRGIDELNIAEYPLTLLSDRADRGIKTLKFQDVFREPDGTELKRSVIITGSDEYGLPTPTDGDVIVALLQLAKVQNNFQDRQVFFSVYELVQMLRWAHGGTSHSRLKESLTRWTFVGLEFQNAWRDKRGKRFITRAFSIIDEVFINDTLGRRRDGVTDTLSSFTWSKVMIESLQTGNVRDLDLDIYFSIGSPIARRVYRFLSKRMYDNREHQSFDLREFAFEKIGLARINDVAQVRRRLMPAIKELESIGFLEPLSEGERFQKLRKGISRVNFVRPGCQLPQEATSMPLFPKEKISPEERSRLMGLLLEHGVAENIADGFVRSFPERIEPQISYMLFKIKKGRTVDDPGAYLNNAIRRDYSPPPGYGIKASTKPASTVSPPIANAADAARMREAKLVSDYLGGLNAAELSDLERAAQQPDRITSTIASLLSHHLPSLRKSGKRALIENEARRRLGLPIQE